MFFHAITLCVTYYIVFFTGLGIIFQLGTDYEKKKQKLQNELHLDYIQYIAKV